MKRGKKTGWIVFTAVFLLAILCGAIALGVPSEKKTEKDSRKNKSNEELLVGVSGTEAKLNPESEGEKIEETAKQSTEKKETSTEEEEEKKETENLETEETEFVFQNGFTVAIDPGHQGAWVDMSDKEPDGPGSENYKAKSTAGTTGRFTQVPEYELNLDISLSLREELENRRS